MNACFHLAFALFLPHARTTVRFLSMVFLLFVSFYLTQIYTCTSKYNRGVHFLSLFLLFCYFSGCFFSSPPLPGAMETTVLGNNCLSAYCYFDLYDESRTTHKVKGAHIVDICARTCTARTRPSVVCCLVLFRFIPQMGCAGGRLLGR